MKRFFALFIAAVLLFGMIPVPHAEAAASFPDSIYIKPTLGGETCTLVASAMAIRARLYLSGNSNWSSVTEHSIFNTAWIGGVGLRGSFTYYIDGNSISMTNTQLNGVSVAGLKSILDAHPEGIVLYCSGLPHAVFLTDYEGDIFYCADPYGLKSGYRMPLASSYLGDRYNSDQTTILNNVTKYWYVSGYNIANNSMLDIGTDFTAPILNTAAWIPLENSYGEGDKPPVRLALENQYANQLWYFLRQDDGSYKIYSCYDGKLLDVRDANTGTGAVIQTCAESGSDAQKWYIQAGGNGYVLRSKLSGYVLDLVNNDTTIGNTLQTWTFNGSGAQIWSIYKGDECKLSEPSLSVNYYNSDVDTVFTWDDVYGERSYTLKIWEGNTIAGNPTYSKPNAQSGEKLRLPAGDYIATVEAENYYEVKACKVPIQFTVISSCDHDFSPWIEIEAATCVTDGLERKTCRNNCGKTEDRAIPALGHSLDTTVTPANCQHTEITTSICYRCGERTQVEEPMEYSDWAEAYPDTAIEAYVETMTQYRYRDRMNTWSDPMTHTVEYAWPQDTEDWQGVDRSGTFYSQYNHTPVSASETDSQKVSIVSTDHIGYLYFHWCRGRTDGPYNRVISNCYETSYPYFHAFTSTEVGSDYDANGSYGQSAKYLYNNACCKDTWWWRQIPLYRQTYTVQTKTQATDGWGSWSDWSDSPVTASDTRQVEERTLYRYVTNLGQHTYTDADKTQCSVCTQFREDEDDTLAFFADYTGDSQIMEDDAIYLLWHNLFPDSYPIRLSGDVNGDGAENTYDAVFLLWYALELL